MALFDFCSFFDTVLTCICSILRLATLAAKADEVVYRGALFRACIRLEAASRAHLDRNRERFTEDPPVLHHVAVASLCGRRAGGGCVRFGAGVHPRPLSLWRDGHACAPLVGAHGAPERLPRPRGSPRRPVVPVCVECNAGPQHARLPRAASGHPTVKGGLVDDYPARARQQPGRPHPSDDVRAPMAADYALCAAEGARGARVVPEEEGVELVRHLQAAAW